MPFNNDNHYSFNRQFQTTHNSNTHFILNNQNSHVTNLPSHLNANNHRHFFDSNLAFGQSQTNNDLILRSQVTNTSITTLTTTQSNSMQYINNNDVTNLNTLFHTQRVQIVQTTSLNVGYVPIIIQNQSVTQLRRTQLLNSASTRDRFLVHNNNNNNNNIQNPTLTHQNPSFYQMDPPNDDNNAAGVSNPQPLNGHFPSGASEEVNDVGDDVDYDGRTHSLPYQKYGPYTCPKCNSVFESSQAFAAHMGSHYKDESAEQRRNRRLAKQRNKSVRLSKINDAVHFKRQSSAAGLRIADDVPNRVVAIKEESGVVGDETVPIPKE